MEQDLKKNSATAARANAGAEIVHVLPMDQTGSHPKCWWGMVEDGRITKSTKMMLDPGVWSGYKNLPEAAKRAKTKEARTYSEAAEAYAHQGSDSDDDAGYY